ncbi:hypothetical protein [Streptacidiphilus sp. EB129]|uniref:hypothetical protein n=1 Tax=Streptacidiphilus sp. EB129 TaxID=3156262 RepID=UPI0035151C8D
MNINPIDRYAKEPPRAWVGHIWNATWREKSGLYARGKILDVAPGHVLVHWLGPGRRSPQWVSTDQGTISRSAVKDFLDGAPPTPLE